MITILTAKEPIRVWIPVVVKEKGSKQMTGLHSRNIIFTKDESFGIANQLGDVVNLSELDEFLSCYPDKEKCIKVAEEALELASVRNFNSEYNFIGIASAVIPQGTQYAKKERGLFVCSELDILDRKLDWCKRLSDVEEDVEQEVYYIITTFNDYETEKCGDQIVVPGASQVINIEEEIIKEAIEQGDWDILDRLHVVYSTREKAEEMMDIMMRDKHNLRLRSIRIPDCCDIHSTKTGILLTRGIIPGREILREIIKKQKTEEPEPITSETLTSTLPEPKEEDMVQEIKGTKKAEDKKTVTEFVAYHSHSLLNPPYLTATSSITCIDSYQKWENKKQREDWDEEGYRDLLVEIADCRGKIRLHNRGGDLADFKNKVRTLRDHLDSFLTHLEETPTPEEIIKKAKQKFPTRYAGVSE